MGENIIGKRFGRLIALEETEERKNGGTVWKCVCDCGNIKNIRRESLVCGKTKSCGCLHIERLTIHGLSLENGKTTKTFNTWSSMRNRCHNKNSDKYKYYGGRGITICKRWENSFQNFYDDMGERPKNKTLDRIDNDDDYCKSNCRWATRIEQCNNRRTNHWMEINGERKTVSQWAKCCGIDRGIIFNRLRLGWNEVDAVTKPVKRKRHVNK